MPLHPADCVQRLYRAALPRRAGTNASTQQRYCTLAVLFELGLLPVGLPVSRLTQPRAFSRAADGSKSADGGGGCVGEQNGSDHLGDCDAERGLPLGLIGSPPDDDAAGSG